MPLYLSSCRRSWPSYSKPPHRISPLTDSSGLGSNRSGSWSAASEPCGAYQARCSASSVRDFGSVVSSYVRHEWKGHGCWGIGPDSKFRRRAESEAGVILGKSEQDDQRFTSAAASSILGCVDQLCADSLWPRTQASSPIVSADVMDPSRGASWAAVRPASTRRREVSSSVEIGDAGVQAKTPVPHRR